MLGKASVGAGGRSSMSAMGLLASLVALAPFVPGGAFRRAMAVGHAGCAARSTVRAMARCEGSLARWRRAGSCVLPPLFCDSAGAICAVPADMAAKRPRLSFHSGRP